MSGQFLWSLGRRHKFHQTLGEFSGFGDANQSYLSSMSCVTSYFPLHILENMNRFILWQQTEMERGWREGEWNVGVVKRDER
jgi:hypothetical protein